MRQHFLVLAVEEFFPTAGRPRHVAEALKLISSKDLEKFFRFTGYLNVQLQ